MTQPHPGWSDRPTAALRRPDDHPDGGDGVEPGGRGIATGGGPARGEERLTIRIVRWHVRDIVGALCTFEYSRPVIFANLRRSRNSRNKGHANISGFTVCTLQKSKVVISRKWCNIDVDTTGHQQELIYVYRYQIAAVPMTVSVLEGHAPFSNGICVQHDRHHIHIAHCAGSSAIAEFPVHGPS